MKTILLISSLLISSVEVPAKTYQKHYAQPCSEVWQAEKQVLLHSHDYNVLTINYKNQTASYRIEGAFGRVNQSNLKAGKKGCTLIIDNTYFSALARRDAQDFYKRVEEELARPHTTQ
jgi:hypothetical protein